MVWANKPIRKLRTQIVPKSRFRFLGRGFSIFAVIFQMRRLMHQNSSQLDVIARLSAKHA